jgi:hypothetical protein
VILEVIGFNIWSKLYQMLPVSLLSRTKTRRITISIIKKLSIEDTRLHTRLIIIARNMPRLIFCITAIFERREEDITRIPMDSIGEKSKLLKRRNFKPLNKYKYGSHNEERTRAAAVF